MDGTIGTMTIDSDNYNDVLPTNDDFETAYAYKADGEMFELDDQDLKVIEGYAWKLRDGTIEVYKNPSKTIHIDDFSYTTDVVWNVENVSGLEKAPAASFTNTVGREVVLVVNTAEDRVRAAFVESVVTDETAPGFDFTLELDDPYEIGNRLWDLEDIHGWLKQIVNVLIDDSWVGSGTATTLNIPKDLGVQFNGDVDMNGKGINNDANGKLIVNGDLLYTGSLDGRVNAESLTLDGGAVAIEGTTVVTGAVDLDGNNLTVENGATLNAGSITGSGTITVKNGGTLAVAGDVDDNAVIIDVQKGGTATVSGEVVANTMTVNGSLTVEGDVDANSVTLADASAAMTVEGSMDATTLTLTTGGLDVTGNLTTTSNLTVSATQALSVGGNLEAGNLNVNDELVVGGSADVGTVTLNNAKADLSVGGNLDATTFTLTMGAADVTGNLTTTSASAITVDDDRSLTVGGTLDSRNTITVDDGKTLKVGALGTQTNNVTTVTVTDGTLTVNGAAYASGAVTVGFNNGDADLTNDTEGTMTVGSLTAGDTVVVKNGSLEVKGALNNTGMIAVGDVTNGTEGTLNVTGAVSGKLRVFNGSADVRGSVSTVQNIYAGQSLIVHGDVTTVIHNAGDLTIYGDVTDAVDGQYSTTGTLNLYGEATITTTGKNATFAEINLMDADAKLTVNSVSTYTITVTTLTGVADSEVVVDYTASDGAITLPNLVDSTGAPVASISVITHNGAHVSDGENFVCDHV